MEVFNNRESSGEPARSALLSLLSTLEPRSSDIGVTQKGAIKISEPGYLSLQLTTSAETTVLFQNDKVLSAAGEYEVYVPAGTFVVETHTIVPAGVALSGKYQLKIRLQSAQRDREGTFTLFSPPVVSGRFSDSILMGCCGRMLPSSCELIQPSTSIFTSIQFRNPTVFSGKESLGS